VKIEAVNYNINWKRFKQGYSFFIPCLDPERARRELFVTTKRLKLKVITKVVIEDGVQGLRIWCD